MKNYLHILGSGSAQTTPCHKCKCKNCREARKNQKYRRDCSAYLFRFDDINLLIDYGAHLLNKYGLDDINIDYIFISHAHSDHFKGLFPLSWTRQEKIPIYYSGEDLSGAFKDLLENPKREHFIKCPVYQIINLNKSLEITPILLNHNIYTTGFFIKFNDYSIVYLLDTKGLPKKSMDFLKNQKKIDLVLIDSNYGPQINSNSHNNINDALEVVGRLEPKNAILTHISHKNPPIKFLQDYINNNKPIQNVFLAFDGLKFKFKV
ncbi:MAG: MBL fold metallo-hydrolase [Candidatus Helarchaeota archaeon]